MNGSDGAREQISSREIFGVIFRRRVPIVICALIVTAAALSAASRAKAVYDATAKILLRRTGSTALASSWTPFYGLKEEMNTEMAIVVSDPVLERAVEILNEKGVTFAQTNKKPRVKRPPTTGDVAGGLTAQPVEDSNIMLIRFRGPDPEFARQAADAVAEAYVEFRVQIRKASGIEQYFGEQLARVESELVNLTTDQLLLRKQGRIYDREWQQRVAINRQYEMQVAYSKARSRRLAEEEILAALNKRLEDDPSVIWPFEDDPNDHLAAIMLTEFWNLQREADSISVKFTLSSPQVRIADSKIARMEQRLREEAGRRIRSAGYLIEDLKAQEAAYEAELAVISEGILGDPEIIAQIEHLDKQIHYTYLHYDRLLEKMLDMVASEADDIRVSNAKILNPAVISLTKAGRMKSVYVVFSIVLGITLGIGFGFLLENLDHSFKSASEVEEVVGAPLLGSIPESRGAAGISNGIGDRFDRNPQ